jgi:hypothetical protein
MTRFGLALLAAAVLAFAAPASADAAKLKKGVYDCMRYDYFSGFMLFTSTVKLKDGGKYEHSFGREGKKFDDPSKGTYKIKGKKIKFRKGGMAKTPARIVKKKSDKYAYFELLSDGKPSGLSCYYVAKP